MMSTLPVKSKSLNTIFNKWNRQRGNVCHDVLVRENKPLWVLIFNMIVNGGLKINKLKYP